MIGYTNYLSDARVRREAETLAATGDFDVTFLALQEKDPAKSYEIENVKVVELNVKKYRGQNKFKHFASYMKFLYLAFCKCNKLLFSRRLDVIHVHNMPNFLVWAGFLPRVFGKKMILDIHDSTPETYFARYGEDANQFLFKILCWEELLCCSFANKVISVNHVQRDELVKRGIPSKKIVISMNVPDPKWFRTDKIIKHNENTRKKIIYHGTVAKRLGIDLAIRAFAKISNVNPSLEFHIIGDGEGLDECTELSKLFDLDRYVHFSNTLIPLELLFNMLENMEMGLVANRKNPATELMLPVKLLEYVALGIPAVVPRLRTIEYYFTDEMVSYFEPEDVESLAQAILDLSKNDIKSKAQAEKARAFLDQYGWGKNKMDLINLYKEI